LTDNELKYISEEWLKEQSEVFYFAGIKNFKIAISCASTKAVVMLTYNCIFVVDMLLKLCCLQVLHAQQAGYGAVIVYNNGSDDLITMHGSVYMEHCGIFSVWCQYGCHYE